MNTRQDLTKILGDPEEFEASVKRAVDANLCDPESFTCVTWKSICSGRAELILKRVGRRLVEKQVHMDIKYYQPTEPNSHAR